ncbi:flagellar protein FlaG [Stappia sp. MMSF_3263]|uniref:flagellar protein FlaG n=1 Tax=Stappia sp. MMSF_3263 TaxID=3046693 RepID=UPI00273F52A4|nr:flagellar protein FlaG [Stappia sp. MMSF_3263]
MEATAIRTPAYASPPATVRPSEPTDPAPVPTDVPPEKAVQPATESAATRRPADNGFNSAEANIKREEYRDKVTDSLVFRAVDINTGEVVRQIPEESLLRLRRAFAETTHKDMTGLGFSRSL